MFVFHSESFPKFILWFPKFDLFFPCCANVLHGVIKQNILCCLAFWNLSFENNTYFCNNSMTVRKHQTPSTLAPQKLQFS